jgi:hypothetical protein
VAAGEVLMDVFDAGATATGQQLDARIGGSTYNVALGLAQLAQNARRAASRHFSWRRLWRCRRETVQSYEVGRRRIPVSTLRLLAKTLSVSLDELMAEDREGDSQGNSQEDWTARVRSRPDPDEVTPTKPSNR